MALSELEVVVEALRAGFTPPLLLVPDIGDALKPIDTECGRLPVGFPLRGGHLIRWPGAWAPQPGQGTHAVRVR